MIHIHLSNVLSQFARRWALSPNRYLTSTVHSDFYAISLGQPIDWTNHIMTNNTSTDCDRISSLTPKAKQSKRSPFVSSTPGKSTRYVQLGCLRRGFLWVVTPGMNQSHLNWYYLHHPMLTWSFSPTFLATSWLDQLSITSIWWTRRFRTPTNLFDRMFVHAGNESSSRQAVELH